MVRVRRAAKRVGGVAKRKRGCEKKGDAGSTGTPLYTLLLATPSILANNIMNIIIFLSLLYLFSAVGH